MVFKFAFRLLLLILQAQLILGASSNVIQLKKTNFVNEVIDSDRIWLVEFFAPWCGHCQRLAPEWEKAATNLKGIIPVGAINCDEEKELCGAWGIKGFPTIKLFPSETSPNPYQKGLPWKTPIDYNNARTASAIVNFGLSQLSSAVASVNTKSAEAFFTKQGIAKVLLFTDKPQTPTLYKALSLEFKNRLLFGEVKHKETNLVQKYDVQTFPTILVIQTTGEKVLFEERINHENLVKFLTPFALPKQQKTFGQQKEPKPSEPKKDNTPAHVYELTTQESFSTACLNKPGTCVIAFLSPLEDEDAHKEHLKTLQEVANKYKNSFNFMWTNGPKNYAMAEAYYMTSGFPSLLVLNPKKLAFTPFVGTFGVETISGFLDKVSRNRVSPLQIEKIPSFSS